MGSHFTQVAQTDLSLLLPAWSWVSDYLGARHSNRGTLETQLGAWATWQRFLVQAQVWSPAEVTRDLAEKFLRWRLQTVKRVTAVTQIHILHAIMEEAVLRGLCVTNPLRKLRLPIGPVREKPEVSPELEAEIRAAIEGDSTKHKDFLRLSMTLGIYQGRRIAETRLPLANVDFEANTLRAWVKGGKWHIAPMHPKVRQLLLPLKEKGQQWTYEHPSEPDRFSFIWHCFLERHGFTEKLPGLSFHSFRVSCVTRLARAGVTETKAMNYVCHSSLMVHQIYMRLRLDDLGVCVSAL